MYSRVSRGFTLIELLVVIAIIAILAAILFPVYVGVKTRAKKSTCNSNMKSIATAFQGYIDDYDAFPDHTSVGLPYTGDGNSGEGGNWIRQFSHRYQTINADGGISPGGMALVLGPYMKSAAILKCPSEWKKRPASAPAWWKEIEQPYIIGSSYYYKHVICWRANRDFQPVKQSHIQYYTRCVLLYEEAWHGERSPFLWNGDPDKSTPFKPTSAIFMDLHVGTVDIPLFDTYGYDGNWIIYTAGSRDKFDVSHIRDFRNGGRDIF